MWLIAGLLATAGICAAIEIPSLTKHKKDLWVFSLLLLLGTVPGIAIALKMNVPNPLDWIAFVFQPFANWMKRLFQ